MASTYKKYKLTLNSLSVVLFKKSKENIIYIPVNISRATSIALKFVVKSNWYGGIHSKFIYLFLLIDIQPMYVLRIK